MNGGLLLYVRDEKQKYSVFSSLERQEYFTSVITASQWNGTARELAIISFDGESIELVCLAERRRGVATGEIQIKFSKEIELTEPLSLSQITDNLSSSVRRFFDVSLETQKASWITRGTWLDTLRVIRQLRPSVSDNIDNLIKRRNQSDAKFLHPSYDVISAEKDAFIGALNIAGFREPQARQAVTSWQSNSSDEDKATSSFVASIDTSRIVKISEDEAIDFDASKFGDWSAIANYITGERIFTKGDETLWIRNVNRKPIERTLGVDLVYYNYTYKSFVLVQYKKMTKREGNSYKYRPDRQFEAELSRMIDTESNFAHLLTNPAQELGEYRLNQSAFFFKFHENEIFNPENATRVKGIHIPLEYWQLFAESDFSKGAKGGLYVGYENIGRYLNNTEFEYLVGKGLIGSNRAFSEILLEIVEPLVSELNHSVTIAAHVQAT